LVLPIEGNSEVLANIVGDVSLARIGILRKIMALIGDVLQHVRLKQFALELHPSFISDANQAGRTMHHGFKIQPVVRE
jgi:hypothetical protein